MGLAAVDGGWGVSRAFGTAEGGKGSGGLTETETTGSGSEKRTSVSHRWGEEKGKGASKGPRATTTHR